MTSTRHATPLHAFVLAALVLTAGGMMQLKHSGHTVGSLTYLLSPDTASGPEDGASATQAAPALPAETTAQRRARFAPFIAAAAQASKVEGALIEAIITAESSFNPLAISRTGAVGLMQLMPDTAQRFGVKDRTDPEQNIMGGAKYLNFLLHKFPNPKVAIAAYNAGEGNVKKHGNKIPPFPETRKYVPTVLAFYRKYRED